MRVRALIVDDERLARARLARLLAGHDWVRVVGQAANASEALRLQADVRPEVVFLDIRMPGLDGIELARQLETGPQVVFTTAYREHAADAFALRALDYLLKPIDPDRLDDALTRLREALGPGNPSADGNGLPATRFFVRRLGTLWPLPIAEIVRLEADGDYVALHTEKGRFSIQQPLSALLELLDPERFVRVHRSHVVNLDFVQAFRSHDGVRLRAELRDGSAVVVSRRASRRLRQRGM